MADRVHAKTVTCAAGVAKANAIEVALPLRRGAVERVEIRIPGGHAFLTGLALAQSHGQTIPFDNGDYLIGEDDRLDYQIVDNLRNGAWSALVYNLDPIFAHTWYVRFSVIEMVPLESDLPSEPIPLDLIYQHAGQLANQHQEHGQEHHGHPDRHHAGQEHQEHQEHGERRERPPGEPAERPEHDRRSDRERGSLWLPGRPEGPAAGREHPRVEHQRDVHHHAN